MTCGGRDFVCYLLGLLASHGVELSSFGKLIPWLGEFITHHAQAIIGLLGFSFGVWKWWRFHDRVLHKRLRAYLRLQDERLGDARRYIADALHRPGAERRFAEPLFTVRPLRKVLSRKNWEPLLRMTKLETSVDRQLDKALRTLGNRLEAAEGQLRTLRHQQASAYFLKGAIASARAGEGLPAPIARQIDYKSLDAFRAALHVPGHEADVEMLEYEARQLLRLGYLREADERLQSLDTLLAALTDPKARDLGRARARRLRALIMQALAIANRADRESKGGSLVANGLLVGESTSIGALALRAPYGPFQGWDGVEQGDLHYTAAFVCRNLGHVVKEREQLALAETEYRRVFAAQARRPMFGRAEVARLKAVSKRGLERVILARGVGGREVCYDEAWLLPPLEPLERPAGGKGDGGSDQPVQQAAQQSHV